MTSDEFTAPVIIDYCPQLNKGLWLECSPENYIDRFVMQYGLWEHGVTTALICLVDSGDICVDVGANAGYFSLIMAAYAGAFGRVLAFEPNPSIIPKFKRNLSLNPEIEKQVELWTIGLGKKSCSMFVAQDETCFGNAALQFEANQQNSSKVEIRTLDSFNLNSLGCLKIDVEGMELDVLMGAEQTIKKNLPNIVFETLNIYPPERHKAIADYLTAFDYKIYCISPSFNGFIEVSYPYFPQDNSYAIHPSRIERLVRSGVVFS